MRADPGEAVAFGIGIAVKAVAEFGQIFRVKMIEQNVKAVGVVGHERGD